ncbi:aminoglycoside phosphotransferase family protein [Longispora albida]|uniref:aminoglycoside phosphotransferase family protein n=1 Tax=Longispora albida TaxID=203523 RepID=UPI0003809C0B|nr:aminoglycoside phosphotransferase family protein [Longispora albida]
MSDPGAPAEIDEALLRRLLHDQAPHLAGLPLAPVSNGWDNVIWRLGDALALRITRRAVSGSLHANEQRWLPILAPHLPVPVPAPVVAAGPSEHFPWPWSVAPWYDGNTAEHAPLDRAEAPALGRFLAALHVPAPADAPSNPFRGVPLGHRQSSVTEWTEHPATTGDRALITAARAVFDRGLAAEPGSERLWLHGDLHPRNVLVRDGRIAAVLDWGDMAAGDAATDLAALWWLFDPDAHSGFWHAYGQVSAATWHRGRAWAAVFGLSFLNFGLSNDPGTADTRAQDLARAQLGRVVAPQRPPGIQGQPAS